MTRLSTLTRLTLIAIILILTNTAYAYTEAEHDYDEDNGDEINQICAGCHGEFGMGGKDGKYPRLAGMPTQYIFKQMVEFRERKRPNMPMVEHVDDRQMPDKEIMDISIFLNRIKLKTHLSKVDETAPDFDAYARLQEAKKTIQIGRAKGDVEKGRKLYQKECKSCHGKDGMGKQDEAIPQLAGQYTKYLWRQIKLFIDQKRTHDIDDPEEEFLKSFSQEELQDIFAYASTLDD